MKFIAITDNSVWLIDITPAWVALAPVNEETARLAGRQADRLVSLHDLGRINDDDIRAADVRTSERLR